ncbi:hypothetical protein GOP47_0021983 [Adiantum capillus-veneris]|uniref:Uncharacterized protein n=1 Tax=Adiantum capillus-veneris TaxID=13818 RepID=A0A9D4UAI7_ADICA|nr:hypothetical protein GOP47_0021983 [Adiantum capillus-veneris]
MGTDPGLQLRGKATEQVGASDDGVVGVESTNNGRVLAVIFLGFMPHLHRRKIDQMFCKLTPSRYLELNAQIQDSQGRKGTKSYHVKLW